MASELATTGTVTTNIEQVLLGGDLSKLNPQERLNYYNAVCQSLKLNPLTQPFSYIVLNGKLQLYARKDATEQLRKVHGVSVTKVDPKMIGDLVVVVSEVSDREGRTDAATGAVSVVYPDRIKDSDGKWVNHPKGGKHFQGEDLANAMMKAETKSKRRATLSICGLGMLDETEIDTLREQGTASEPQGNQWQQTRTPDPTPAAGPTPAAAAAPQGDPREPDIRPRSQRAAQPPAAPSPAAPAPTQSQQQAPQQRTPQGEVMDGEPVIFDKQRKRLFAIQKSVGLSDQDVIDTMRHMGLMMHRDNVPKSKYEALIDAVDPDMKFHTNTPK